MGFKEVNSSLCVEGVPLSDIAKDYGTPTYVYSTESLKKNFNAYFSSVRERDKVCFSVKSNSNIHILELMKNLGSGFDVVSGGELKKCLIVGAKPESIVFSGVGKSLDDIELALENNIYSINVESKNELERIITLARANGKKANCSIRINPDIFLKSHKYIRTGHKASKFGLSKTSTLKAIERALNSGQINLIGLASHIGSQIRNKALVFKNLNNLIEIFCELKDRGISLEMIDIGGGLPIPYNKNDPKIQVSGLLKEVISKVSELDINLVFEPGRSISGNAGILLTRVEYLKKTSTRNFAILDAGMNDFLRPSLYDAWHNISNIEASKELAANYYLVGPVCESADTLGEERLLSLDEDSILAIHDSGAYGHVMSSNYNSRTRPSEVLVEDCEIKLIRRRESFEDLISQETNL